MAQLRDGKAVSVRHIRCDDAEAAAELSGQLGYKTSPASMRTRIEQLLCNAGNQAAFVACVDDKVVAWIEIAIVQHLQSDPRTVVGGLVVQDGMRSLGIGSRLLSQAEKWSCEKRDPRGQSALADQERGRA